MNDINGDDGAFPNVQISFDEAHTGRNETAYRLAYGITSFPYADPSSDAGENRLTGIRIDVPCGRTGMVETPYYVLLKRSSNNDLRLHRHTIPAHVPIKRYEEQYLPLRDEGYGSEEALEDSQNSQNLHAFAANVRNALVSWKLRREAVQNLQEQLIQYHDVDFGDPDENVDVGRFGITKVDYVEDDARMLRISWADGSLGRLSMQENGVVERAVIFTEHDTRSRLSEKELTGIPIEGLPDKLRRVWDEGMLGGH